jgi:hypothetical protein
MSKSLSHISTVQVLARSMLPSRESLLFSCLLAFTIMGTHAIDLAISGQVSPSGLHDVFLQSYNSYLLKPLAHILGSSAASTAITLLVWGVVGFVVFETIAFVSRNIGDIQSAHRTVTEPRAGMVVRHPLERTILLHIVWRLLIGFGLIAFTVVAVPLAHACLLNDYHLLDTVSTVERLRTLGVTTLAWMLLLHTYVVLARLYLFRTRVFGEIIY